ncbi:hypothetical protein VB151_12325 [Xanthomonas fragariae]|uniref:hypothetical protein n=1 Tax=Xanthomonas fragariae TaxID=48664 RepID=UPI0009E1CC8C|nr:hypothetical protein [Xanthomonas fragariae]MBL9198096.1 hypothetical protein [Xanthomonas fragariae]MBL9222428.1 hypothetical protein [Xanthomonas fragariae]MDM7555250.1 hypothetical protein [Xanthomonas fragariae]MDM7558395.1 hypothetical protein [Xanthomonas fragariae]MDM7572947.1 hypothetical protein [Xanthomonas fragariae]
MIASDTFWREGLPQWVALSEVAAELGLHTPMPATPEPTGYAPVDVPISGPQATGYPANVLGENLRIIHDVASELRICSNTTIVHTENQAFTHSGDCFSC